MPFLVSALIHALVIGLPLTLAWHGGKGNGDELKTSQSSPGKQSPSAPNLPFAPKQPMLVELVSEPKPEAPALKRKRQRVARVKPRPCTTGYDGVGLTHTMLGIHRVVYELAPGGPAESAGVRIGDILLNTDELLGPAGSVTYIQIIRDGEAMSFKVTRERICQDGG